MNQQDEQSHLEANPPDEPETASAHELWQTYKNAQSRHQKFARPVGIVLGIVLVALIGVALWIVAIL